MASSKRLNGSRTQAPVSLRVRVPSSLKSYAETSGTSVGGLLQGAVDDYARGVQELENSVPPAKCAVVGCKAMEGSYLLVTRFPGKNEAEGLSLIKQAFEIDTPLCELHAKVFDICRDHDLALNGPKSENWGLSRVE